MFSVTGLSGNRSQVERRTAVLAIIDMDSNKDYILVHRIAVVNIPLEAGWWSSMK